MGNVKIIGASAGSGKTYRLAYEYVKSVVSDPSLYRRILAVTFTNRATGEMSSRILERLHELASGGASPYLARLTRELAPMDERTIRLRAVEAQGFILHDYSRFAVLTIDRFFQRLIRSFIRELGVEVNFNLELETDSLLELAADALIDDSASDAELRRRLFAAARDRIEDNKRWNIKEPLLSLGTELFGEEYARAHRGISQGEEGSADTSSLIEAIVEKATAAKAEMTSLAAEALSKIKSAGLGADDFKGRSRSFVAWLGKVATGEFVALSNPAREALESHDASGWTTKTSPNRNLVEEMIPVLQPLLTRMDALYTENSRLVGSASLLRENYRNFLLLSDLQQRVEQICREGNIMPISETNRMIARLVGDNDTPFIFEKAGSYYSRFFIDEFQDTSTAQWENFVPLLKNAIASEEGTPVMLIGDIKQAIYRWRGGDWQILSRRVHEDMGSGRVDVEMLDTNHRSACHVVEFNNMAIGLIASAGNAELDKFIAEGVAQGALDISEAASLTGMLAEAYRDHTQKPKSDADEGYVTLTVYDANDNGEWIPPVVERIEELQSRGYASGDIAVLVRSNEQGARVAQMLLSRKHSNPGSPYRYDVITQDALRVGAAAVSRFIIACLSLAADRDDSIQRAVFNRWLGNDFGAPLAADDIDFFANLATLSPEEAFEETVVRFELQSRTADIAYIQAIHQQITTFSSRSVADIPLFLKWWNEKGAVASITMGGGDVHSDAITISTIHKSKGLQYKAVIVPYLSWTTSPGRGIVWAGASQEGLGEAGYLPINFKEAMAGSFFAPRYYREQVLAHIDTVNMFYVAVTRAEQELHLMTSSNPHLPRNAIGNILRSTLGVTETLTTWGTPLYPARTETTRTNALKSYPTSHPETKVLLRLPSSQYFEDAGSDVALSPRDSGILMHRVFENAAGADDVHRTLDRMAADALVSQAEYIRLKKVIHRAFENPLVVEWFSDRWTQVRNESDILTPRDPSVKRPDRVMIKDKKAVVVDYKFGRNALPAHAAQLRGYVSLLGDMGYTDVEGYLWYVSLGKIEKI
jgi:ATP-dependent exoDNAse (exonuclease V) beta subunit